MNMYNIHALQEFFRVARIPHGKIEPGICQRQAGTADNVFFLVLIINIAEGKDENIMPGSFEKLLVDLDVVCDPADIRFVAVNHHSDSHTAMLRHGRMNVKVRGVVEYNPLGVP